jgi:hypothetical protein
MAEYRCYILDADDHIVQAHDMICDSDAQAGSTAEGLLARDPYHRSAEIWNAARRVMKLERDAAQRLRRGHRMPLSVRAQGSPA